MIKKLTPLFISIIALFLFVTPAFAHVVVHPSTAGVASFQEFSMSVPTEKDFPTVGLKLLIPGGLQMVTPNVKPGWTITEKKIGTGEDALVSEIDWTGGIIGPGQRDDFLFQAQVPAKPTTLVWKAYQTYQDGSVVIWDHAPSKNPQDDNVFPPYSTTQIVNDLSTKANTNTSSDLTIGTQRLAMVLSVVALALSTLTFIRSAKKN